MVFFASQTCPYITWTLWVINFIYLQMPIFFLSEQTIIFYWKVNKAEQREQWCNSICMFFFFFYHLQSPVITCSRVISNTSSSTGSKFWFHLPLNLEIMQHLCNFSSTVFPSLLQSSSSKKSCDCNKISYSFYLFLFLLLFSEEE